MALDQETLTNLQKASAYLRAEADFNLSWTDGRRNPSVGCDADDYRKWRLSAAEERTVWADAIDAAILLNADLPNMLKQARSNGYQAALSHDCDSEEWGS